LVVGIMQRMLGMRDLSAQNLQGLTPEAAAALAAQMLQRIQQQDEQLALKDQELQRKLGEIERKDREIAWRDAKLEKVNFELARLKRWKFGARTETMTAEQRRLFEDTLAEDEASLRAQLAALQAGLPETPKPPKAARAKPRRQPLPEHLERVEHRHEPEDTTCPTPACGQPMQRVGEDISEKLDIIPAKFFVHRHIYGKWACRCCQSLHQQPAEPDVVDGGIPASGLVAHTLISRFVDHLPYYRIEDVHASAGVHTPRSTLSSWGGAGGAALEPLGDALKRFVLGAPVLHVDETTVPLLDPGKGRTKTAYIWAYARSEFDAQAGVVYEFCTGRGAQFPLAFLGGQGPPYARPAWQGTLLSDQYAGYDAVLDARVFPSRTAAGCVAHARRKFEELTKSGAGASPVALEAMQRLARVYHVECHLKDMTAEERLDGRRRLSRPLWDEFQAWLRLERSRVAEGSRIAQAIDYSLNHWPALARHLHDGAVPIDNNLIERQFKPWKLGAKNWLFIGSELAGQRAAIIMSLVQSAKLNGLEPWAYLRDVLARIHSHPSQRIDELLPHRWQPA
jgi:transposase